MANQLLLCLLLCSCRGSVRALMMPGAVRQAVGCTALDAFCSMHGGGWDTNELAGHAVGMFVATCQCHCQMTSTCHLGSKHRKAHRSSFILAASSAPALFDLMGCIFSSQLFPVLPPCVQVDVRRAEAVSLQPRGVCCGCHAAQGAVRQPGCHGNMVCRRARR